MLFDYRQKNIKFLAKCLSHNISLCSLTAVIFNCEIFGFAVVSSKSKSTFAEFVKAKINKPLSLFML